MTDERFDRDLRSVLVEDAPREVPDDLARRVAAIPATHPVSSARVRHRWIRPVPVWVAAAAVVAVVALAALWQFGPDGQPSVGDEPSSSPSAGTPGSTAPATSPGASAGAPSCVAAGLEARILGWQGAAGSRIADVQLTNTTGGPCIVRGTPALQLVDGEGRVLLDSATAGPSGQPQVADGDPGIELAPGASVRTEVRASNYCGPIPVLPIDIAFTLTASGGQTIAVPGPGVSSADATPPCMGSTAGVIDMNGWRR
jgi:hypothetical protein